MTARRVCVIRQAVAGLLVAVLMVAVGVLPSASATAAAPAAEAPADEGAMVAELRAMREDFRTATSDARVFLKVAGGWVGGVATMLLVDGNGRVRRAVVRGLSQQEPKR